MRRIVVVVLIVAIVVLIYSTYMKSQEPDPILSYSFDFEDGLDTEFWMMAPWESLLPDNDLAAISGGILKISQDTRGVMPYLLSKPIEVRQGDVVTMKRKIRVSHGGDTFSGGTSMYQTSEVDLVPEGNSGSWSSSFGDGVFLIEYAYDLVNELERPGRDVVRFLAADWEYNDNYTLISPVYDEWIEEIIVFDTRSSQISYTTGSNTYRLSSYPLDRGNIRFMIHPYGTGYGNSIELDSIEITVENKNIR